MFLTRNFTGFLSILLLSLTLCNSTFADKHKGCDCKDGMCEYHKKGVVKILELEGERADRVRTIQKKYKTEKKVLKKQLKDLKKAQNDELRTVLSKDEMKKLKAYRKHKKNHKKKHNYADHNHDGRNHHGDGEPKKCDH